MRKPGPSLVPPVAEVGTSIERPSDRRPVDEVRLCRLAGVQPRHEWTGVQIFVEALNSSAATKTALCSVKALSPQWGCRQFLRFVYDDNRE